MKKLVLVPVVWAFLWLGLAPAAWSGPSPDTGQTQSYTDTFGEDSDYLINPPSYTKLDASGKNLPDTATSWVMVLDNVTGLIWEVKTDDGSVHDKDNTYTWYDSNPATNGGNAGTAEEGTDTEDFINALNAEDFGGHSDWRLPAIKELDTIVNLGPDRPAIDVACFPNTVSDWYWSSSTDVSATDSAWRFGFHAGYAHAHYKSIARYVRAVRGGQARSFSHLVINGDGTVTDASAGLMWQQVTANAMTWEAAISYCEGLSFAGYTDWRLPNRKELRLIVDYNKHTPAIDTTYFPNTVSSYYWSSTTTNTTRAAWGIYFYYGYDYYDHMSSARYVRSVRGGQSRSLGHLVILAPDQGSSWTVGNVLNIAWDTAGLEENVAVSISREGGKAGTFETIVATTANDGAYDWTVTGPGSVNCVLKIEPLSDTSKGTTQGLFTISGLPITTTTTATSITASSATLNATVNPSGTSTIVTFEYGATTSYGSTVTAAQSPLTGAGGQTVSADITGLIPGVTYHFRVKGENSEGTSSGSDVAFTTSGGVPIVATNAANSIASTSAMLNGTVNPNEASTTVTFEYGATGDYGSTVTASQSLLSGTTSQAVSAGITGLNPSATYHFRVKATNVADTTYGSDASFTTVSVVPTVLTSCQDKSEILGVPRKRNEIGCCYPMGEG